MSYFDQYIIKSVIVLTIILTVLCHYSVLSELAFAAGGSLMTLFLYVRDRVRPPSGVMLSIPVRLKILMVSWVPAAVSLIVNGSMWIPATTSYTI